MKRIGYLSPAYPLMMLIVGVVTFEHWGDTINIPDNELEDIRVSGLLPVPQIRYASSCTECDAEMHPIRLSETHHPRYLSSLKCRKQCIDEDMCQNINYSLNISSLKYRDVYGTRYSEEQRQMCLDMWESKEYTISVGCKRVPSKRIG